MSRWQKEFDCCSRPKISKGISTSEWWWASCLNCGQKWEGNPQSPWKRKTT